jgi:uncharacterized protein YwgA
MVLELIKTVSQSNGLIGNQDNGSLLEIENTEETIGELHLMSKEKKSTNGTIPSTLKMVSELIKRVSQFSGQIGNLDNGFQEFKLIQKLMYQEKMSTNGTILYISKMVQELSRAESNFNGQTGNQKAYIKISHLSIQN